MQGSDDFTLLIARYASLHLEAFKPLHTGCEFGYEPSTALTTVRVRGVIGIVSLEFAAPTVDSVNSKVFERTCQSRYDKIYSLLELGRGVFGVSKEAIGWPSQ